MWLFSVVFLPALFCLLNSGFFTGSIYKLQKSYVLPVIFSAILAIIFCAIDMLLIFSYRNAPASFYRNFFYLFAVETFTPICVITLLYTIFVKQKISESLNSISNLFFSFFSIYLPYRIFTRNVEYSSFVLFYKPIMYGALFVIIQNCMLMIFGERKRLFIKKQLIRIIINGFFIAIALCFPTITEAFYCIGGHNIVWMSLFYVFCLLAIASFLIVLFFIKSNGCVVVRSISNIQSEEKTVNNLETDKVEEVNVSNTESDITEENTVNNVDSEIK